MKKYIIFLAILVVLSVWWAYTHKPSDLILVDIPPAQKCDQFKKTDKTIEEPANDTLIQDNIVSEEVEKTEEVEDISQPDPETEKVVINSINLDVPFTSQAPTANWAEPFQDACEEASILMVAYYYENRNMPSAAQVENILVDMVDWQIDNMTKEHINLTISQTADLVKSLYNYDSQVIENLTADKIRELLRAGQPVIVPANGHLLANPYFTDDGPDYHMLVIKGFVDDKFITNDPGTKRGADFIYSEDNLMSSIFDWDSKKDQAIGLKRGLVFYVN